MYQDFHIPTHFSLLIIYVRNLYSFSFRSKLNNTKASTFFTIKYTTIAKHINDAYMFICVWLEMHWQFTKKKNYMTKKFHQKEVFVKFFFVMQWGWFECNKYRTIQIKMRPEFNLLHIYLPNKKRKVLLCIKREWKTKTTTLEYLDMHSNICRRWMFVHLKLL